MDSLKELKSFSVVHCSNDNTTIAIPSKWISEDQKLCWWPNTWKESKSLQSNKDSEPGQNWLKLDIRVMKSYCKS